MNTTDDALRLADYRLTDEQQALSDVYFSFFADRCTFERVRAAEPLGFDPDLWSRLCDMGTAAMVMPDAPGRAEAGLIELALVAEAHGRHLAPVPLVEVLVASRLLAHIRPDHPLLEAATRGDAVVTFALHPAHAGTPQLVPAGAVAGGVIALVGHELVLATNDEPGAALANQGYTPLAWWDVTGPGVQLQVLAEGADARAVFERARREWKLLMAAALVGMSQGALQVGVEHAKSRWAYGVPIGSFQAVSHPLVNVAIGIDAARRLVRKAAWYEDHDPASRPELVPMAYLHAAETAMRAGTVSVHVLGGLGFTTEGDSQLYFRRAKGWTLVAGDPEAEIATIAEHLYGSEASTN